MNKVDKMLIVAGFMSAIMSPLQANAATFLFNFSGIPLGNTATATGSFDITDAALTKINQGGKPAYGSISNLVMTVSGAGIGNGTFTNANFATFFFSSPTALDFTKELVGQPLGNGSTFGANKPGETGEFNFFSGNAPSAYGSFTLGTNHGKNQMVLTSLMPSTVPEPASWAMMIVGVGAIGYAMRRRSTTRVTYAP